MPVHISIHMHEQADDDLELGPEFVVLCFWGGLAGATPSAIPASRPTFLSAPCINYVTAIWGHLKHPLL
jgi:hypothetical protein